MPFADLNGTESSGCAASTGTPDTKGKWIYLMEKNVPIAASLLLFLVDTLTYWHPYSTSKRCLTKGSIHMEQ
ncbi:hypothetical protein, partial [Alkalicoccus luteus]|uniref:hypothetical protein n=1 Tax=Alkalicoccus luteus TaxID=1237094 RepID=UPI0014399B95